jgi:hypothetical protein
MTQETLSDLKIFNSSEIIWNNFCGHLPMWASVEPEWNGFVHIQHLRLCHGPVFHWTWTRAVKINVLQIGPKEQNGDFLENSWNNSDETSIIYVHVDHRKLQTRLLLFPWKCHIFLGSTGGPTTKCQLSRKRLDKWCLNRNHVQRNWIRIMWL